MAKTIQKFSIAGRPIGEADPPYCIAEAGINHNGEIALAKKMIEAAKETGADAIKFQTFKACEFCGNPHQTYTYRSQGQSVTESMLSMFQRCEFSAEQWREIKHHCDQVGITFFSTPQNSSDLDLLLTLGIPAIKVGSDDLTNLPLIQYYTQSGLPLILSCGMSDLAEVYQSLDRAGFFQGYPIALLLCTSEYPTPKEDVHLRKLITLQSAFPGLVTGFSDHTQGALAASLAVAMGAVLFEKHFTLDHNLPGPDHWFSEDPQSLALWIQSIHQSKTMLGSPNVRPTAAELEMRGLARRSIVALTDIQAGEKLTLHTIGIRRPYGGLPPSMLEEILGTTASRPIQCGEIITLKHVL